MEQVNQARLQEKSKTYGLTSTTSPIVNWDHTRLVTPGKICGYETIGGLKIASMSNQYQVQLFRSGKESQALFYEGKQVIAGTVTSKIHTTTKRSEEKKATHIQYDKNRIDQKGKDFQVDIENYRHCVNYDGGHIIDHKFSAEKSHTTEKNYFPQHFYYNQTIKEYLVKKKRCDDFIEIPLYTPNPPVIGVKGRKCSHLIPVAIIFVQIQKRKIRNVYCFPNAIDYKKLSENIGKGKGKAEILASYFRLDSHLNELLRPAIITDYIRIKNGVSKQTTREQEFLEIIDDVTFGMSLTELSDAQECITALSFSVLHKTNVHPLCCIQEKHYNKVKKEPLTPAFNALGSFLVKYGIKNALKTEVLSINSRLIFCNVIIEFIECYHQVSDDAIAFIATLAKDFHRTLSELERITPNMNKREHLFFINTTLRLSSPSLHAFSCKGYDELYDPTTIVVFLKKTTKLLRSYLSKYNLETFSGNAAQNIIEITREISSCLDNIIEIGFQEFLTKEDVQSLRDLTKISHKLLERQKPENGTYRFQYQTSPTKCTQCRTTTSYLETQLAFLANLRLKAVVSKIFLS